MTNRATSPASGPSRPTWPARSPPAWPPPRTTDWRYAVIDDNGDLYAEGRLRYRPTAAQTAFIRARDRTCRAPGCRKPAMVCHIDHNNEGYLASGPSRSRFAAT
jgi:hypothetical protein